MELKRQVESIEEVYLRESKRPESKFPLTCGEDIDMVIFDFQKPICETIFKSTTYLHYECFVHSREGEIIEEKKIVQMPSKLIWCELYGDLKEKNLLHTKNIRVHILEIEKYFYIITILDK